MTWKEVSLKSFTACIPQSWRKTIHNSFIRTVAEGYPVGPSVLSRGSVRGRTGEDEFSRVLGEVLGIRT